jgi:porphobilinogen deaminase
MVQTEHVVGLMEKLYPDITFEVVAMSTTGDQV